MGWVIRENLCTCCLMPLVAEEEDAKDELCILCGHLPANNPHGNNNVEDGGEEEIEALRGCIESGWWGKGPKVAEFEKKFAEMVGAKYAVAVTSATHGQQISHPERDQRAGQ